ncbi:hypothetical protein WMY93_031852 [Mugilogobius chulae]|uniref:B30.2/SPRY domain-containing protein n=1 Tax=Mugilogobius chulae TaxID=88201 RepID=A0AAW0MCT0_9GOBI
MAQKALDQDDTERAQRSRELSVNEKKAALRLDFKQTDQKKIQPDKVLQSSAQKAVDQEDTERAQRSRELSVNEKKGGPRLNFQIDQDLQWLAQKALDQEDTEAAQRSRELPVNEKKAGLRLDFKQTDQKKIQPDKKDQKKIQPDEVLQSSAQKALDQDDTETAQRSRELPVNEKNAGPRLDFKQKDQKKIQPDEVLQSSAQKAVDQEDTETAQRSRELPVNKKRTALRLNFQLDQLLEQQRSRKLPVIGWMGQLRLNFQPDQRALDQADRARAQRWREQPVFGRWDLMRLKFRPDRDSESPVLPRTRDDFLQYYTQLTLDPNTAHKRLSLSDGNRRVMFMSEDQHYPNHPDRFSSAHQVLSRESLTGRCYWEVESSGERVIIAVSYRDIQRKSSNESYFGTTDKSWALYCGKVSSKFVFESRHCSVPCLVGTRIGVSWTTLQGFWLFTQSLETQASAPVGVVWSISITERGRSSILGCRLDSVTPAGRPVCVRNGSPGPSFLLQSDCTLNTVNSSSSSPNARREIEEEEKEKCREIEDRKRKKRDRKRGEGV